MPRKQTAILWAIIISESSHIFCCVLPTVFSMLAVFANLGMFIMPASYVWFHDLMHEWEFPMVALSGAVLALGWGLHWKGLKGECHTPGCQHHPDPAHPKRSAAHMVLVAATILFVANVFVFLVVHRGMGVGPEVHAHEAARYNAPSQDEIEALQGH